MLMSNSEGSTNHKLTMHNGKLPASASEHNYTWENCSEWNRKWM